MSRKRELKFRTVQTAIWDDEWFLSLPNDAKVAFVALFTSRRVSHLGMYGETPYSLLRLASGLDRAGVDGCLDLFEQAGKIVRDGDGRLWVRNFVDNQTVSGRAQPGMLTHRRREVAALPEGKIRQAILEMYPELDPALEEDAKAPAVRDEFDEFAEAHQRNGAEAAAAVLRAAAKDGDWEELRSAIRWAADGGADGWWRDKIGDLSALRSAKMRAALLTQYRGSSAAQAVPSAVGVGASMGLSLDDIRKMSGGRA